jgi:hypothetical protein
MATVAARKSGAIKACAIPAAIGNMANTVACPTESCRIAIASVSQPKRRACGRGSLNISHSVTTRVRRLTAVAAMRCVDNAAGVDCVPGPTIAPPMISRSTTMASKLASRNNQGFFMGLFPS